MRAVKSGPTFTGAFSWAAVYLFSAALFQMLLPAYFDADTGYHLAVARLTRAQGVLHEFPWTPFSWLSTHYADKEFLFHVFLLPFSGLDPNTASAAAGTLLGAGLLGTLYYVLSAEGVEKAGLWTLTALTMSGAFIARFSMVRPHLLSITLSLLTLWAASRRRRPLLAAAAFLFPLCYTAWHLPVILVGICAIADTLSGRKADYRGGLTFAAALAAGIAVHPNFPANVKLFWIQNVDVLFLTAWAGRVGIEVGGEFRSFSAAGLARYILLPAAVVILSAPQAWRRRSQDTLPLAATLAAAGFLALTLKSQRFIEYLVPFAALAAALARRDKISDRAPVVLLATGAIMIALFGRHPLNLMRERTDMFPPGVVETVARVIPPGAQVFTCDWQFTGSMMLALPGRRFIVALDPVFFAVEDPERFRIWFETVRRPPEGPALLVRDTFGAEYVMCSSHRRWNPFLEALDRDADARRRAAAGHWRIYQLRPLRGDPVP